MKGLFPGNLSTVMPPSVGIPLATAFYLLFGLFLSEFLFAAFL
jgi:hypothetical protein